MNYFYDQKTYYLQETARLQGLYEKAYHKKRQYKKNYKELVIQQDEIASKYEREIIYLKENLYSEKKDILTQTEIDSKLFNKMHKNHDLITHHHKIVKNKQKYFEIFWTSKKKFKNNF
jgi:hypothetical protein